MTDTGEKRQRDLEDLSDLAGLDDERLPLAETALRIALVEYPRLDVAKYLDEIESFAERADARLESTATRDRVAALDGVLFDEEGFRGNAITYYDPRNSFLNDVVERRVGIPITLSILYIEVGHRLGLDLRGIGFPGHFLVGLYGDHNERLELIDPFNRAARVTRDDCARTIEAAGARFADSMLDPSARRQILVRLLTNLKLIYIQKGDFARAVPIIDRILQLSPENMTERRDRGLVLLQLGKSRLALRDLEAYAETETSQAESEIVRNAIVTARRELARLN